MSSELPAGSESSEELFNFLLEKIPDQVYFKDRQGRFMKASRAVADYLDVADPDEIIGKSDL
ncbi:MAG TPA: PAS domain-containing protein, partial [Terrimicrobiaceae bacterium]